MAFPASPSNNQVHKEGNRAFVYDSALGTWDQVRETDSTDDKILRGDIGVVTGTIGSTVTLESGVTFPAGMAVNAGYKEDFIRYTLPRGIEATFGTLTMSYNKIYATSKLFVVGTVLGRDDQDGHCGTGFKYGSSAAVWCGSYTYEGGNYMVDVSISGVLVGHTTTGLQTLKLVYGSGTANLGPFRIMNPTNSDTSEFIASKPNVSTMMVWEVM